MHSMDGQCLWAGRVQRDHPTQVVASQIAVPLRTKTANVGAHSRCQ